MAIDLPGVDRSSRVTSTMITNAYNQFGRYPAFWARYFTDYTTGSDCEYSASAESSLLHNAGIKALPNSSQNSQRWWNRITGLFQWCKHLDHRRYLALVHISS